MTCNYYRKLVSNKSKLVYSALTSEIELHNAGKTSWITYVNKIMALIGKTHTDILQTKTDLLKKHLKNQYTEEFFKSIRSEWGTNKYSRNKLRTYALIKIDYNLEKYLLLNMPRQSIIAIARLRTSTHNLEIETGRYVRPRVPTEQRLCKICKCNKVEDEIHFILHCPEYNKERQKLIQLTPNLTILDDDKSKFIHLLTHQNNDILKGLGTFIVNSNKHRKALLKPP